MAESYKDMLGFTWKKEGNKYVQYRADGTKTGKTKPITSKSKQQERREQMKKTRLSQKNKYKPDPNNPIVGDTKITKRSRVGSKWVGGETLYYTGTKWVSKEEYKKITPDRVGSFDRSNSKEYKLAKEMNERVSKKEKLKINKKEENNDDKKVIVKKEETNDDKKVIVKKENNNEEKKVVVEKEKSKYPVVTQEQLDKKIASMEEEKNNKDKKETLKIKKGSVKNWIRYQGKMYKRGTPMARRAEEAERRRKALAAKGYMKKKNK